jgi:predicted SAM-dependent methyltransferase
MKKKSKKTVVKKTTSGQPLRIDMGCGQNCKIGEDGVKFTGVDYVKCQGVDIVHDLTKFPYPFKDNSADEIFASHFVEHLTGEDFIKFMDEAHRILKPGAKMELIHPYCFSARAFQDPTHKTFIPAERYMYFDKNWRQINKLDHYPIKSDYEYQVFVTYHGDKGENWTLKAEEARNYAMGHYVNVVADLIVHLKKR